MAQIDLGSIKFNWKGSYSGATAYVVDDVVESSGSSYICIAATTGNAPPNATYWELMSQAGTNGTDGTDLTTTLTTQGDLVYYNGSALARLGAGTSGQVLQTNGTGANPSWVDASSGSVLQQKVGQYHGTTNVSKSYTSYEWLGSISTDFATASSITITPDSSSSKFEIYAQCSAEMQQYGMFFIFRSTDGGSNFTRLTGGRHIGNGTGDPYVVVSLKYYDAPNTSSDIIYRLYARANPSSNSMVINNIGSDSSGSPNGAGIILAVTEYDGTKLSIAT